MGCLFFLMFFMGDYEVYLTLLMCGMLVRMRLRMDEYSNDGQEGKSFKEASIQVTNLLSSEQCSKPLLVDYYRIL